MNISFQTKKDARPGAHRRHLLKKAASSVYRSLNRSGGKTAGSSQGTAGSLFCTNLSAATSSGSPPSPGILFYYDTAESWRLIADSRGNAPHFHKKFLKEDFAAPEKQLRIAAN
jgi:hypothetical protein